MLYKVLISLNDKGKWLIFLFCLNREGHNRSKSEDDKPIVPDHDLMYDRNGSRPLTSTRYAKFKMYRWLHKRKSKLFFSRNRPRFDHFIEVFIFVKYLTILQNNLYFYLYNRGESGARPKNPDQRSLEGTPPGEFSPLVLSSF